ncbi:MAG: bifunctional riboflavin kinase/FAD synthetase [Candidatus Omnitrophica bacterium]|nr:bifunctional riboflavin kinase/FAD synthetase [Candidatus Omnitrophota bacterium]MBU1997512.1 bifunctional riboflavin kinase/FAD synthetase [Candidatus Omnitrophota bacterium]
MKIIYELGQLKKPLKDSVMAIGVFDGVHKGHQMLIKKAVKKAKLLGTESVVMTFSPHPVSVLHPKFELSLITSLEHKTKLIEALEVDILIVVKFTRAFAFQSPDSFIEKYIVNKLNPKEIYVGDDFRFGSGRIGEIEIFKSLAKPYGFKVNVLKIVKNDNNKVSSTNIRNLIKSGDLNKAKKLLGRYVSLEGTVVKGDARGRKLGFPTANIIPDKEVIPPLGVYAAIVTIDDMKYKGVTNVGLCPVFRKNAENVTVETFIFDFNKLVYSKVIEIAFVKKMRDELNFKTQDELVEQMKKDESKARRILLREAAI